MSRFTDLLGMDEEVVTNKGDAYFGYAEYLTLSPDEEQYLTEIASCYLISAVYRGLVNPFSARQGYSLAARYYLQAGRPYGKIIAVCSTDPEVLYSARKEGSEYPTPEAQFADLIVNQYLAAQEGGIYDPEVSSAFTVGSLHIPLRTYSNAFRALREVNGRFDQSDFSLLSPIRELLYRAAEIPEQLMVDTYHWNNSLGTVLPYEPETLAACLCICAYGRVKNWRLEYLVEAVGGGLAGVPLLVAMQMMPEGRRK